MIEDLIKKLDELQTKDILCELMEILKGTVFEDRAKIVLYEEILKRVIPKGM